MDRAEDSVMCQIMCVGQIIGVIFLRIISMAIRPLAEIIRLQASFSESDPRFVSIFRGVASVLVNRVSTSVLSERRGSRGGFFCSSFLEDAGVDSRTLSSAIFVLVAGSGGIIFSPNSAPGVGASPKTSASGRFSSDWCASGRRRWGT